MPLIFLLFIVVPIIEIWILIKVGGQIGALNTIMLVVLTAVIGTAMLRTQGLSILARMRAQMAKNQTPAQAMFEGLFLVVGGALLLTPGFVTDATGFLCLLPATRGFLAKIIAARFAVRSHTHYQAYNHPHSQQPPPSRTTPSQTTPPQTTDPGSAIEGEYKRED